MKLFRLFLVVATFVMLIGFLKSVHFTSEAARLPAFNDITFALVEVQLSPTLTDSRSVVLQASVRPP